MKAKNKETGNYGEELATQELRKIGYEILDRNYANKFGEIDIIARDKQTLVFVEVKTKIGTVYGIPEEMVSKGKLQRVRNMATIYMDGKLCDCRIDVVAIILSPTKEVIRLTHYTNVY